MHSKLKGNIGEMAVAKDLMLNGYAVFTELGDLSCIDLIAVKDSKIKRIQVKTQWDTSIGVIAVDRRSTGPGYSYEYTSSNVDVIAAYAADRDKIVYVYVNEIESENKRGFRIRFTPVKNGQKKHIRLAEDFSKI